MARFIFQLEGVLRHRRNQERQLQRELALIQAQRTALEAELRALDASVRATDQDLRANRLVGKLDLNFLAAHRRYSIAMQRKAMGIAQKMSVVQRQLDEARARLAEAAKQRKAVEKLREKQFEQWKAALSRKELIELDEVSMQLTQRQYLEEFWNAAGKESAGISEIKTIEQADDPRQQAVRA